MKCERLPFEKAGVAGHSGYIDIALLCAVLPCSSTWNLHLVSIPIHSTSISMKIQSFGLITSLVAGAAIAAAAPAQAFTSFSFTTNTDYVRGGEKNDINLNSVTIGSQTIDQFNLVKRAAIQTQNSRDIDGKTHGLLSTVCGDNVACDAKELPSNSDVVAALGNRNMNYIVDTEEFLGSGTLDVFFEKPSDTFMLFERGGSMDAARAGNSALVVQGLDAQGNTIGSAFTIGFDKWNDAGYAIDTKEIGGAQRVGSYGLKSSNGMIAGLRLITNSTGADFKVIAANSKKVPEPATLVGFAIVGGAMTMVRRRKAA